MDLEYLTDRGRRIFGIIKQSCESKGAWDDIYATECAMISNSFDLYITYAAICNNTGCTQKPKEGGWDQIRPEYTVMKNEYANILKHSAKFGLNPTDRQKIFGIKTEEKPPLG